MATTPLEYTSVASNSGFTNPGNVATSNDVRATDGVAGDVLSIELDNAPADYNDTNTGNTVTLQVEATRQGTFVRTKQIVLTLTDSGGTAITDSVGADITFTTPDIGASDQTFTSSAFTLSDNYAAADVDGWRLQAEVTEGGGMPDSATVEVDYMALSELQYDVQTFDVNVDVNLASLTLTTQPAEVNAETDVDVGLAALTLSTHQASVNAETAIEASSAALTLTTHPATINAETNVEVGVAALTLTTHTAQVSTGASTVVNVDTAALTLTTHPAEVNAETSIEVGQVSLSLATHQASVNASTVVNPPSVDLTLTTLPATVSLDVEVLVGVANLTLTTQQASVVFDTHVEVGLASLTISTYKATISGAGPEPESGSLKYRGRRRHAVRFPMVP